MIPTPINPPETVAVIGLGHMGLPMAQRLVDAGYDVHGFDVSEAARDALAAAGGAWHPTASAAVEGAAAIVLLLPTSVIVRDVLIEQGALTAARADALVLDMGSSQPLATQAMAAEAGQRGVRFIDAPVSGGVAGARAGKLTIMVGGDADDVAAGQPLLDVLGATIIHVGPIGAGHAVKALNNLLSATHLLASSEALTIAKRFGLDPATVLSAINGSSGRSASTERKLPDFVLTESFASGFAAALMLKDMRTAVELGAAVGAPAALGADAVALWEQATEALDAGADHTEIARWVEAKATEERGNT